MLEEEKSVQLSRMAGTLFWSERLASLPHPTWNCRQRWAKVKVRRCFGTKEASVLWRGTYSLAESPIRTFQVCWRISASSWAERRPVSFESRHDCRSPYSISDFQNVSTLCGKCCIFRDVENSHKTSFSQQCWASYNDYFSAPTQLVTNARAGLGDPPRELSVLFMQAP